MSVKPSAFRCSNCDDQALETFTVPRGKLDRCPACHWLFMDRELLGEYAADKDACMAALAEPRLLSLPTNKQCPRCFTFLSDGRIRSRQANLMECSSCKGLWTDFAALGKFEESLEVDLHGAIEKALHPDAQFGGRSSDASTGGPARSPRATPEVPDTGPAKWIRGIARSLDDWADKMAKGGDTPAPPSNPPPKPAPRIVTPQTPKPKTPAASASGASEKSVEPKKNDDAETKVPEVPSEPVSGAAPIELIPIVPPPPEPEKKPEFIIETPAPVEETPAAAEPAKTDEVKPEIHVQQTPPPVEKTPPVQEPPKTPVTPPAAKPPVITPPAIKPPAPKPPAPLKKAKEKPAPVPAAKPVPASVPADAAPAVPLPVSFAKEKKPPKEKKPRAPTSWPTKLMTSLTWIFPIVGIVTNAMSDIGFEPLSALGDALFGWSLARLIQLWRLYSWRKFPRATLQELEERTDVRGWKSVGVTLEGEISIPDPSRPKMATLSNGGRPIPLNRFGRFEIIPKLLGVSNLDRYAGQTVTVRGWYRRRPEPTVEIQQISAGEKSQRSLVREARWAFVLAFLLVVSIVLLNSD